MKARVVELQEEPIYFVENETYFPTELKKDDPFNTDLKFTVMVGDIGEPKDIFVGVLYKGNYYVLGVEEGVAPNKKLVFTWIEEPPTIAEFVKAVFGEELKGGETLELTWLTGYVVSRTDNMYRIVITDELPSAIYIVAERRDILPILIGGALLVGLIGIVIARK